ncbi:hypothetical protein Btru_036982 [Bulinus truncatus]|nr:hypothetical protein Btru_036982 [Bulinus truncatus]
MDDVCDNPLEIELQSLEAIYVNELTFSRKDDGSVDKIEVLVHPATGHDTTKQYVCMTLVFVPGSKYPDEIPDIEIRNPRGLGEEEVASLVEAMILKGEEVKGEVMLYTFIEMAKDSLTEGNIPHCPCVVCLEHFHEHDSFHRTSCYHYFHSACLYKYVQHTLAQLEEEKKEVLERRHLEPDNSNQRAIVCPLCRTALDDTLLSVTWSDDGLQDENEDKFIIPPELREQQRKMAEIYERQKAKGGIIDPELEKNKFLVNADDRFFVIDGAVSSRPQVTPDIKIGAGKKKLDSEGKKKHKNRNKFRGRGQDFQKSSEFVYNSQKKAQGKKQSSSVTDDRSKKDETLESSTTRIPERKKTAREVNETCLENNVEEIGEKMKDLAVANSSIAVESIKEDSATADIRSDNSKMVSERQSNAEKTNGIGQGESKRDANARPKNPHERDGHQGSLHDSNEDCHDSKNKPSPGKREGASGKSGQSRKPGGWHYGHQHHHWQHHATHYPRHHQEHRNHQERQGEMRERRQQEHADRQTQIGESVVHMDGAVGGSSKGKADGKSESEVQDDADRKNIQLNRNWRVLNFGLTEANMNDNHCTVMEKMSSITEKDLLLQMKCSSSENKENFYSCLDAHKDDISEYYVGYGAVEDEYEWENEVDPYASERSLIRRKHLNAYDMGKKKDLKHFEERLEKRVTKEAIINKEERRMEKEQAGQQGEIIDELEKNEHTGKKLAKSFGWGKKNYFIHPFKKNCERDNACKSERESPDMEKKKVDAYGSNCQEIKEKGALDETPKCHSEIPSKKYAPPYGKEMIFKQSQPHPKESKYCIGDKLDCDATAGTAEIKTLTSGLCRRHSKKAPPLILPRKSKMYQDTDTDVVLDTSAVNNLVADYAKNPSLTLPLPQPCTKKFRKVPPLKLSKKVNNSDQDHPPSDILTILNDTHSKQTSVGEETIQLPVSENGNVNCKPSVSVNFPLRTNLSLSSTACLSDLRTNVSSDHTLPELLATFCQGHRLTTNP